MLFGTGVGCDFLRFYLCLLRIVVLGSGWLVFERVSPPMLAGMEGTPGFLHCVSVETPPNAGCAHTDSLETGSHYAAQACPELLGPDRSSRFNLWRPWDYRHMPLCPAPSPFKNMLIQTPKK